MKNKCPVYVLCEITKKQEENLNWIRGVCESTSYQIRNSCEKYLDWKAEQTRAIIIRGGGQKGVRKFLEEIGELK